METKKKYELSNETIKINGITLYRIKALKDFSNIKAGDLGGWIEKEDNLSQIGNAWVYDNAKVYGNACICNNAKVYNNVKVSDDAQVFGDAEIFGNAQISDNAVAFGE